VEVIRHQDIGAERERVALAHAPKRFDEGLVVTLPEENLLPVIAARHHVIEQSFGMNSRDDAASLALSNLLDLGKSDTAWVLTFVAGLSSKSTASCWISPS
jgi:hypothetical protein